MAPGVFVEAAVVLAAGLLLLCFVVVLRRRGRKSVAYLTYFTIFYVYLFKVLDYTVFQYQSLLVLKLFVPNLILNGQPAGEELNLVPLLTLTSGDVTTSLLNILLFVPFGFGLPFITRLRMRGVVLAGVLSSIGIELLQFATGRLAGVTFRVADVNDVIFNTAGAALGYLLFLGLARLYLRLSRDWPFRLHPVSRHIIELSQLR